MLLCGLGLAIPGQVGYDGEPGRTWIVRSGWVPGGIDDGGTGKLTLSAALADYAGGSDSKLLLVSRTLGSTPLGRHRDC